MKKLSLGIIALFATILFMAASAGADWINLSGAQSARNIAEIFVEDDRVRLVLEIYVNDIEKFVDLLPEDWFQQAGIDPPPIEERMKRFATDGLQVIVGDNERLVPELKLVEPRLRVDRPNLFAGSINPYTRQPIPGPPKDKRVLYVKLDYPFDSKPGVLTFVPPLDAVGSPRAAIGFTAYHENVPVIDFRYLSEPATLNLDWEDPWYSKFDNRALKRWQQSGLRTFLYVEPFEVRHETLVRLKDLGTWMDLGLRGNEYIEIDEFEPLRLRAGEFLLKHSNVKIDGKKLTPLLDRTSFVKTTMVRTYFIDQPERLLLNTAMLGVVITYLTDQIPQNVTVTWNLFSDRIQKVPTVAEDPAGPFPSYVTPDDPVLTWQNFLKTYKPPTVAEIKVDRQISHMSLPAASILCLVLLLPVVLQTLKRKKRGQSVSLQIGGMAALAALAVVLYPFGGLSVGRPAAMAPKIEKEQAVVIVDSLLKNVYRSFDFREEEDIYDRLATSVSGDLLETIYLQNRKSLVVTQAGGAQAKVKEVNIKDVTVKPKEGSPLGMVFHTLWTVMGTVGHWGHIHSRENQYEADITVEPDGGTWKITALDLLEEKRIDPYGTQFKTPAS